MTLAWADLAVEDFVELLAGSLEPARVAALLEPVGFVDSREAYDRLLRLADDDECRRLFAGGLRSLLLLLADHARPDQALINFERFVLSVRDRATMFRDLQQNPRIIEILIRLFTGSQFLTEILLSNPGYIHHLTRHRELAELKSVTQLRDEAQEAMALFVESEERLDALRRYQRWEMLRIGMCDFFGLHDFRRVTVQLSLLADALVQVCLAEACRDGEGVPAGFAVIALGKLGGEELNYSSDVDLLFIAEKSTPELHRIGQRMIKSLTAFSNVGFMYRVDMRLRPWGSAGELVASLDSYFDYLGRNAEIWEKQALLKARVIAGDRRLGEQFLREVQPYIFELPRDAVRHCIRAMKQKIEAKLAKSGKIWGAVKLGKGSIRDVEFLVQYFQIIHGREKPQARSFNTIDALVRLTDLGILQADEYRLLTDGYLFLRTVEHSLQLVQNKQTQDLPRDPAELGFLAKRLDYSDAEHFLEHFEQHGRQIRRIYNRYLGEHEIGSAASLAEPNAALKQHLARLERDYSAIFNAKEVARHALLAERVDEDDPIAIDVEQIGEYWYVTIVGLDCPGVLSLICGLFMVHGMDVASGEAFTYEPSLATPIENKKSEKHQSWKRSGARRPAPRKSVENELRPAKEQRRKIVDVFTVRPEPGTNAAEAFKSYTADLKKMARRLHAGELTTVQGALVKRVASRMRAAAGDRPTVLYPVQIEIDNKASEQFTVLRIQTEDTPGFLYEFTNALALSGVDISRVSVLSEGGRVSDTLFVADLLGRKIVDPQKQRELQAATVLIKHFTHLMPQSPNPEGALVHFREFVAQLLSRPDWPEELASLEQTNVLEALAQLLGVSDFLWNDFLRMQHGNLFPVVRDVEALADVKPRDQLAAELQRNLVEARDPAERRDALNAFKDREMFRIDMRHILGHSRDFSQFSDELSELADLVVATAAEFCFSELAAQYGAPQLADGTPADYALCALGKCGGREIGFASDIELMFVYSGEGRTAGSPSISTTEFYVKLVEGVSHAIRAHREGIFEIDLRLRPYGKAGSLAVSLDAFRHYFAPDGAAWPYERQALVKLRPIAGSDKFGRIVVALRDELVYTGTPFDAVAMRGMRERQVRQLVTPATFNVKLSPGGLVDAEYLVQGLQITHGASTAKLRSTNTTEAIRALADVGVLSAIDAGRLEEAYQFLRTLIGALRIVRGNAKDLDFPPDDGELLAFLSRRMGYNDDPQRLRRELVEHSGRVIELVQKYLGWRGGSGLSDSKFPEKISAGSPSETDPKLAENGKT